MSHYTILSQITIDQSIIIFNSPFICINKIFKLLTPQIIMIKKHHLIIQTTISNTILTNNNQPKITNPTLKHILKTNKKNLQGFGSTHTNTSS